MNSSVSWQLPNINITSHIMDCSGYIKRLIFMIFMALCCIFPPQKFRSHKKSVSELVVFNALHQIHIPTPSVATYSSSGPGRCFGLKAVCCIIQPHAIFFIQKKNSVKINTSRVFFIYI